MAKQCWSQIVLESGSWGHSVLQTPALVIFGFFVENHLVANTKSSFYDLQFESYNLCRQQALFFSLFLDKSLTSKQKIQFPWLKFWEL